MKMRCVLLCKESGKPKARLVIRGYHGPRVGSEVRGTCGVTSWKKSLLHGHGSQTVLLRAKGDVKNAFLQGTCHDAPPGELAAEPVPTLRKALNLRDDELLCSRKRATD